MTNKKAISLFSSAGIGDLGLNNNNIDIVISNELLEDRHQVFKSNFPKTKCFTGDIWSEKERIIQYFKTTYSQEKPFLIFATPPCQGMSSNGLGRLKYEVELGTRFEEDPRNRLIIPTMDVICELQPEWVLLENVPGMKNTVIRNEKDELINIIDYIKSRLGDKYEGDAEVLACDDFGIPQLRKRLITIFTRNEEGKKLFNKNFHSFFSAGDKSKKITLRDAIGKLPKLNGKLGENERIDFHPLHYVPIMKEEKYWWVSNTKEGDQAYNNQCTECGFKGNARHTDQNIDGKWVSNKDTPIYCGKCNALLPRPTMIDKKSGERRLIKGFHSAYRRMVWDKPAHTLTQNFQFEASDNKIHPSQNRVLSIYEALIIQTISNYPFLYEASGKIISRSKFAEIIGESVPPKLIDIISKKIIRITEKN